MHKLTGAFLCLAVAGMMLSENGDLFSGGQKEQRVAVAEVQANNQAEARTQSPRSPGKARAKRDERGHYTFKARLNGRSIPVLVDTGASSVAINERTARRIGLRLSKDDFRHVANTANGQVSIAIASIREVRIGGVQVRDVQAAILPDEALDGVLLGMSFLNQLDRFEFADGEPVLYE